MLFHIRIRLFIDQAIVLLKENKYYNFVKFIKLFKTIIFYIKKNKL